MSHDAPPPALERPSALALFLVFTRLGLTAFGGPNAHLGYFRDAFVVRRRWLDEAAFADLLGLCQFLPGPASSQLGFAIGLSRRGALGGLAAWLGFTWPSAVMMLAAAGFATRFDGPLATGLLHGLKLVAVAVVGQAVLGMARVLAPDAARGTIAIAAAVLVLTAGPFAQIGAIALAALIALGLRAAGRTEGWTTAAAAIAAESGFPRLPRRIGLIALLVFAAVFALPTLLRGSLGHGADLFAAFYHAGALVFGGGHVILPLLQASVVDSGWVAPGTFLAGYGIAQALPGPLFTFAAFLGAAEGPLPNGIAGGLVALIAIFLPGLLLVTAALPFWHGLRQNTAARTALAGVNAAVVGLLAAALYDPLWTSAVHGPRDAAVALALFGLLVLWKAPPWLVVVLAAAAGIFGAA